MAVDVLQCPSQSPDLNRTEMLWWDLNSELNELKKKCEEEWTKTAPQVCERLIKSYSYSGSTTHYINLVSYTASASLFLFSN